MKRNIAASKSAKATTTSAIQTRSLDTRTPPIVQMCVGRIGSTLIGLTPSRCDMRLVSTTITPIDATAFATAGAVRSGRKTRP